MTAESPPKRAPKPSAPHDSDNRGRSDGWDDPVPLDRRRELPVFPVDALPNWLAAFAEAESIATQTPPDMAGTFTLGAAAAMVQGRVCVEAAPGWTEELAIYLAVLLQPGERKTAVYRDVLAPVVELEAAMIEAESRSIAEARAMRSVLEKRLEAAKKKLAAATQAAKRDELEQEVRELVGQLVGTPDPVESRIFCDDATPEALASLLANQGGSIAVLSAEGGVFDLMMGRYSNGHANLDVYLKGHSADTLRVDRRGQPPQFVHRPVVVMCLAAQPYVIAKASQSPDLGPRGLLDRIAYALPVSRVGHREVEPPPVPEPILREYRERMLDLGRSLRSLVQPGGTPLSLRTSAEARATLNGWRSELEPRRRVDGELGHMQGWASKLDGLAVRLAGLLHLAETLRLGFERPINEPTMRDALRLANYFLAHALAVYDLRGADPALDGAQRLLAWIKKQRRNSFSKRDAHAGNRSTFKRADELDAALSLLERHGWIRGREQTNPKGAGRPRSPIYDVNPDALSTESTESTETAFGVDSAESVDSVLKSKSLLNQTPSLPPSHVQGQAERDVPPWPVEEDPE